jgi:hypothetical protein
MARFVGTILSPDLRCEQFDVRFDRTGETEKTALHADDSGQLVLDEQRYCEYMLG